MFVWEVRDPDHRLVAYCFVKQVAMEWARQFGGTWRAVEHSPVEHLLLSGSSSSY